MGTGYTRTNTADIQADEVVKSSPINAELNAVVNAFAASTGHTHDGTSAEGGPIAKLLNNTLTFGAGTAGTDITITFDGETNDGVLKWMEDEDYFQFDDDILISTNEKIQFRDSGIYISSNADGDLDIVSDGTAVDSINIESAGGITLDAGTAGSGIIYEDDGTEMLRIYNDSSNVRIESKVSDKDILIRGNDGGSAVTAVTFDMSAAGLAIFSGGITSTTVANTLGATSFNDANITNVGNIALDSITADGSTITITGNTTFADGAYDFDIASHDTSNGLKLGGTLVTSTAAELNILDGVTSTAAELNILDGVTSTAAELNIMDGDTSATSTTVADADRVVMNDNGTMVQVAVTDLAAYFDDEITAMPNLITTAATTVGALDSGTIATGFGNIDNGASNITSGGLVKIDVDADADDATGDSSTGRLTLGAGEDLNLYHGGTNSYIVSDTGDLIIDSAADIVLDSDGADVLLKDGGTQYAALTNSSGNLIVKSGSTTALTFDGANVTIAGNLTVSGTQTVVDTVTMNASNAIVFEGATANDHETTLTLTDPTADRTIKLPNQSGTIPVLAADSDTAITSTPAELNKLDGVTATATELNYVDVTTLGTSEASKAVTVDSNGDLVIPDSDKFKFGAGSDMQLYHDGTNSFITNATGTLKLATETSGIAVTIGHTTSEVTVADNFNVTGTTTLGTTSFSDANIINVGDIALDSISSDGTDINVDITDNSATSFTIKEGSNAYLIVDTGNSSESVSIGTGVSGTAITIGHATSEVTVGDNLTFTGNLSDGTINISAFVDEDNMASNSATLIPTQQSVKAYVDSVAATSNNVTGLNATGTELNAVADGDTSASSITVEDADRIPINDGGTMKQIAVTTLAAYLDDEITAMPNLTSTGALDSGSITANFGAIDNGTSGIRSNTVTVETSLLPDASGGADIGSTSAEFGDVYIADDKYINFGSDQNVLVGYDEDGDDSLEVKQNVEGAALAITFKADQGDDNADQWKLNFADGGTVTFQSKTSGSYATKQTLDTAGNFTVTGEVDAASLDISGNADIDGTLEADAITVDGTALDEFISDTVGAMVSSNTETGISVTYDDSDNTLDFVIGSQSIVNSMLADDAVGADELASNAVVNASVASGAAIAFSKMEDLTASRALVSDSNGDVSVSAVTSTEIGYVDGVTSNIQTQLDAKATTGKAIAMAIVFG
ncbi:hypothetical protein [uncultured virus]|uniref:Uncharacterized protein n=1 Tax=uncultured virus TaxID=340016 RepID=A0A218MM59_9VIRU|nr:hypothetical protein [uncultured virus]